MNKYIKKPIEIEAVQWNGNNLKEIMEFLDSEFPYEDNTEYVDVRCEYIEDTTNNRTEMMAAIEGIKWVDDNDPNLCVNIDIVSDSGYLVKGFTDSSYLSRWMANGWKTSTGKPVLNRDMWIELNRLSWLVGINFIHIKGHKKDRNKDHVFWNDICDRACTYVLQNLKMPGFIFTLRYNFKSKDFTQIGCELVERSNNDKNSHKTSNST